MDQANQTGHKVDCFSPQMKAVQSFLQFNPAALINNMSGRETNTQSIWQSLRGEESEHDACRYIRTDCGNGKQEESLPAPLLEERPHFFHLKFMIDARIVVVKKDMRSFFGTMLHCVGYSSQRMNSDQTKCVH